MKKSIKTLALALLLVSSFGLASCDNDDDDYDDMDKDTNAAVIEQPVQDTTPAPVAAAPNPKNVITTSKPISKAPVKIPTKSSVQSRDDRNDIQKAAAKVREGAKEVQETSKDVKETAKEVDQAVKDVKGVFGGD